MKFKGYENPRITPTLKRRLTRLKEEGCREIYDAMRYTFIARDMESLIENDDDNEYSRQDIEHAAYRYVYDGDYDCNIDYWSNLQNLLDDEKNHAIHNTLYRND